MSAYGTESALTVVPSQFISAYIALFECFDLNQHDCAINPPNPRIHLALLIHQIE